MQVAAQRYIPPASVEWNRLVISSLTFHWAARMSRSVVPVWLWFVAAVLSADTGFYWVHRSLHTRRWYYIHRQHHEYRDTHPEVANHKSFIEFMCTLVTDMIFPCLCGGTMSQLIAWSLIGTLTNLEGHSGKGVCFIQSDFHDSHHTIGGGNYGVHGLWDQLCGTVICK